MTRDEAQKQIAEILKQVEKSYGWSVRDVGIVRQRVTKIGDDHEKHVKQVKIEFVDEKW